ncbi:hypothetical protein K488DRAFT_72411 [Vararia minispora EC-137]|uniref:Uncharacterized protein n=1 Tax=Vararia minispora EC-137 TaxID=1314806 RepID=A0ACB8QEW7_9AGAM|nr:hypothetical protein K488DRAFT_72411 [Vararia minispora EC-137]
MWQTLSETESTPPSAVDEPIPRSLLRVVDLDANPAPPYRLFFNPRTNGYEGEFEHFRVKSNHIFITLSDGQPERRARAHPDDVYVDPRTHIARESRLYPVPREDKGSQTWRLTIGSYIGTIMFGHENTRGQSRWFLHDFPEHYELFGREKEPVKDGKPYRKDRYLHGCPSTVATAFRSPNEFTRHAMWLMDGMPRDEYGHSRCLCIYCNRTPSGDFAPQKPVTDELRRVRREILLRTVMPPSEEEDGNDELAND